MKIFPVKLPWVLLKTAAGQLLDVVANMAFAPSLPSPFFHVRTKGSDDLQGTRTTI